MQVSFAFMCRGGECVMTLQNVSRARYYCILSVKDNTNKLCGIHHNMPPPPVTLTF